MRFMIPIMSISAMILVSFILFRLFQNQASEVLLDLAVHPEIVSLLEDAGEDLRSLAKSDPENAGAYRQRFDNLQTVRQNLLILSRSRENLGSRYETILALVFGFIASVSVGIWFWNRRRLERRIAQLGPPLEDLAAGKTGIKAPLNGKDLLARMGRMIEQTGQLMAGQRDRIEYLKHLSEWQEAARRLAHEIRTPLTTMQMELQRLPALMETAPAETRDGAKRIQTSALEEIERLRQFTKGFSSFASIGKPQPDLVEINGFVSHFGGLFATAWPGVVLETKTESEACEIHMDKGMVRQVLMNLCNNAAHAMESQASAKLSLSSRILGNQAVIDVEDNGPGVDQTIASRLFQPYVTTRKRGKGMGLGLSISRKIMLEHGGDLELVATSPQGSRFRMSFPLAPQTRKES